MNVDEHKSIFMHKQSTQTRLAWDRMDGSTVVNEWYLYFLLLTNILNNNKVRNSKIQTEVRMIRKTHKTVCGITFILIYILCSCFVWFEWSGLFRSICITLMWYPSTFSNRKSLIHMYKFWSSRSRWCSDLYFICRLNAYNEATF